MPFLNAAPLPAEGKIAAALLAFFAMELFLYLYLDSRWRGALWAKAGATLMPVLLCLTGAAGRAASEPGQAGNVWLVFAALCVCLVSDVLINLHFLSGVVSFLAAHLLLIAYLVQAAPPTPWSLPLWAALYGAVLCHYWEYLPVLGNRKVPLFLYPAALMAMASLALALPFLRPGPASVCLAAGAACFSVSDLILADGIVRGKKSSRRDHWVMHLYEPAVYLIALSTVF